MSYLVLKGKRDGGVIPVRLLKDPKTAQDVIQPTRWRMLQELCTQELCAKDLAERTAASVQVVCYHLKVLEKLGLVRLERSEKRRGAVAKYYRAESRAFAVVFGQEVDYGEGEDASSRDARDVLNIIGPYTPDGEFNGRVIVGSPDPHGIFRSRARCGHLAAHVTLFLGSLLAPTRSPAVRLDTETTRTDLAGNLILIGGPRVNTVSLMVNDWLPITYEMLGRNMMISRMSGMAFEGEEYGAIQLIANPMNSSARVLILAGNSYAGTHSAVLGFIRHLEEVARGNTYNRNVIARVVRGVDDDADGLVDRVEFLE